MRVEEVCKTEHPVAMPGQKARGDRKLKGLDRQKQERQKSESCHQVSSGKTDGDGTLTKAAKILYLHGLCSILYLRFLK